MLVREAHWFRRRLNEAPPAQIFPLLNVGSQTAEFRAATQPWIERQIFTPARQAGHLVTHTDIQQGAGIDLVGDLLDPGFRDDLQQRGFRSVMLCNILEHVHHPRAIAEAAVQIVPPGGRLFVSVPYRFPFHPDPIDTMFRPSAAELAALFPGTKVLQSQVLWCGNLTTYLAARLAANPRRVLDSVLSRLQPPTPSAAQPKNGWGLLPWLIRPFYVTCLVLMRDTRAL